MNFEELNPAKFVYSSRRRSGPMKSRLLEKLAAVVCASCLAIGVMNGVVFARDEDAPVEELPQGAFVILDDSSQEADTALQEVTDNRTSAPLYVDGQQQGECPMVNGEPYVSVTALCQALGLEVQTVRSGDAVQISADGITLEATTGDIYFVCNGRYLYAENGVQSDEGDVLLPVEALAKCFGVSVSWDRVSWHISVDGEDIVPLESGDTYYDDTDVYWLSRVIYAEASGQSLQGQIAVADVVLNRMNKDDFGDQDSVYGVIFAKNQFEVVINGMIYMTPDEQSQIAAKIALEGVDLVSGAVYFADNDLGNGYQVVTWLDERCFMTAA
jgi:N-acetylmuramoyl-L-alanine amidase